MSTAVRKTDDRRFDRYGIERTDTDDAPPAAVAKVKEKAPLIGRAMEMQERYTEQKGNLFAAGITYFSVLSLFPLLMIAFAIAGFVLAGNASLMEELRTTIASSVPEAMSDTMNSILDTAIEQRNTVGLIGLAVALWTGLGWMNNLRGGISEQWKQEEDKGNFVVGKAKDLLMLLGLLLTLAITFAVTALGSASFATTVLGWVGLDEIPGMNWVLKGIALIVAIAANWILLTWIVGFLPRAKVPLKSVMRTAVGAAVVFEVFKQFATMFFTNALNNPAGAAFGPIIGIMVLFYFTWRIVLYTSAWAATTKEAKELEELPTPAPAVIRVRSEVRSGAPGREVGAVAALAGLGAAVIGFLLGRRN